MEFPRLVYRSSGSSFDHCLAESDEERLRLLDEGWYDSVPEALANAGKLSPAQERAQQEEAERKAQAEREAGAAEAARIAERQSNVIRDNVIHGKAIHVDPLDHDGDGKKGGSLPRDTGNDRKELEAQAKELGLKFDGRNSNASLQRMIDEALKS